MEVGPTERRLNDLLKQTGPTLTNDLTCSNITGREEQLRHLARYISNDPEKILGCYGFRGLFLNRRGT